MLATTLSFENMHEHGQLLGNLFKARHEVFNNRNGWGLTNANGMEYDQYDTPASRWIAVHDESGQILAGIRLTPTTAKNGVYSYMLRDAQLGLLDGMPDDMLEEQAPIADHVWEGTRIFVSQAIPARERTKVHVMLVQAMTESARSFGASRIIGIIPEKLPKIGRRVGLDIHEAGPVREIAGSRNVCVNIYLATKFH